MQSDFIKKGNSIRIEIEVDPTNLIIHGIIGNIDDALLEVAIEGTYIQNTVRNATCIIPGDVKTLKFDTIILGSKDNRLFLTLPTKDSIGILQRRKHKRSPMDEYVNCSFVGFNEKKLDIEQIYSVKLIEISMGGVRLKSQAPIPLGSILRFELSLHVNPAIKFKIKVLRCVESLDKKSFELGCEFIDLSESDALKIEDYCSKFYDEKLLYGC